jgi:hypothetical protein
MRNTVSCRRGHLLTEGLETGGDLGFFSVGEYFGALIGGRDWKGSLRRLHYFFDPGGGLGIFLPFVITGQIIEFVVDGAARVKIHRGGKIISIGINMDYQIQQTHDD